MLGHVQAYELCKEKKLHKINAYTKCAYLKKPAVMQLGQINNQVNLASHDTSYYWPLLEVT